MTYIVGIKTATSVTLIGDQAITTDTKEENIDYFSSFGETHVIGSDETVSQKYIKIHQIKKRVIFTYAGFVPHVYNIFSDLQFYIDDNPEVKLNLDAISNYILLSVEQNKPQYSGEHYILLLGFMEGDVPMMVSYDSKTQKITNHQTEVVQFGSITNVSKGEYVKATETIISDYIKSNTPDEILITLATSLLQSYGIHANYLMDAGIGGAFTGVQISKRGISWQPNTLYIVYNLPILNQNKSIVLPIELPIEFEFENLISVLFINKHTDNPELCVGSTEQSTLKSFFTGQSPEILSADDLKALYFDSMEKNLECYVFISKNNRVIYVIKKHDFCGVLFRTKYDPNDNKQSTYIEVIPQLAKRLIDVVLETPATNIRIICNQEDWNQEGWTFISGTF